MSDLDFACITPTQPPLIVYCVGVLYYPCSVIGMLHANYYFPKTPVRCLRVKQVDELGRDSE